MTRRPHSVLPKALRRGGERPLQLTWPAKPTGRLKARGRTYSKRQWQFLQRSVDEHFKRLGRRDAKAARSKR